MTGTTYGIVAGYDGSPGSAEAVQVAGHAAGRVVVVRGRWRPVNQAPGPVVVGVDGSPASRAAVGFALEEATLGGTPLIAVVLHHAPCPVGIVHP
jgi:hypothetical protein